jgi:3-oxoacyl-[acyl-carrier protein] reductase
MSKTVFITGANKGLGFETARRLTALGHTVLLGARDAERGQDAAARLGARFVRIDVTDDASVAAAAADVAAHEGRVDVLVNNAGILPYVTIAQTSDELFERTMAINVTGTFNTMRAAASRLAGGGRIVNFSTSILHMAPPTYGVYAATKGAVEALTRVFAKELRGRGITCNAVAPGPVATALFLNGKSDEQVEHFAKMAPLERLGRPEDIAGVVSFLVGPDGAWVNGQVLRANGGIA